MADNLRGKMDATEYKHVVLGLVFLKYISDAFEGQHWRLQAEPHADSENPDEYHAQNIFLVPAEARWACLKAQARQPTIGQLVDDAIAGIERDDPDLKADFILANRPSNVPGWGGCRLREDNHGRYGAPPAGNAKTAWVQYGKFRS